MCKVIWVEENCQTTVPISRGVAARVSLRCIASSNGTTKSLPIKTVPPVGGHNSDAECDG